MRAMLSAGELDQRKVELTIEQKGAPMMLTGVGLVSIAGGQKPAVRIQANPSQLAGYGLSLEDIRTALGTANVDQAKGSISGSRQSFLIGISRCWNPMSPSPRRCANDNASV